MNITILNGNPDAEGSSLDQYLQRLEETMEASGHSTTLLNLRDLDIRFCTGCFGCWVKTPGECAFTDDSAAVCRAVINSDFMLWAAPLHMGFPSMLLKRTMDRSIPLILPYFEVDQNEAHHLARYARHPRLGLLLEREPDTDEADLQIVADIFARTALNMKSRLEFAATTDTATDDVARRIEGSVPGPVLFEKRLAATTGTQIAPVQRLTLFNGSPRGAKGNTPIMLEQFAEGFASLPGRSSEMHHLAQVSKTEEFVQAFRKAECVWLGFPLYTDAMPGLVKGFIEALEPLRGGPNPPIGFLVQSGFPEATHSRHVERYLEKLAARLGSPYLGTIVKGNGEGTRLMPESANRKLFGRLQALGRGMGETGQLDPTLLRALSKPERYPDALAPLFKLMVKTPLVNFYWNQQLKQNGAYERRFARPYAE
jgi:multimeric flavodoxin WrbA